ncbi:MAG TPA: bacteriohopanetetrol glucosamine biosynthesis glycosyltransferase HpnI [Bryobacteraceae bacterium]|nr:bacteriohopanetetrol glucosamine biosynthesis glycosyltransferase HpnI [Bryobacteraceae bacterium]
MFLTAALLVVVAGSIVYSVLTIVAAREYLGQPAPPPRLPAEPVSVLKPLAGAEERLEENLRSFLVQQYPAFEILFAVRRADDAAVAVVEKLRAEFPAVPLRLILTGEPPYPNAKVYSLDRMKSEARYDLLVMSDSDIQVTPGMLAQVAAEFADPRVGLTTCPYRAVPGKGVWSALEALGMNTQFLGGILTARMLEGMKFALGPTITARKSVLDEMGGFDRLKDYLAEDFVMGKFADELGYRVLLSSYVIEHHIGSQDMAANLTHRLRWCRSTRRSRPAGYVGELFTMPLATALLSLLWAPAVWPVAALSILLRAASAWACAGWVLRDPLTARLWWLLPVQDLLAFAMWIAGFFGNHIVWRGRRYFLHSDGRFELEG